LAAALARLPETPSAWTAGSAWVPDWLLGAGGLALVTYLIFLVAMAGWTIWEKQEVARFFQRAPHRSIGVGGSTFALAWLCIIAFAPGYASAQVHPEWHMLVAVWWVPITLAAWCAWKLYKSVPVPGTPLAWGRIALVCGEDAMVDQKRTALRRSTQRRSASRKAVIVLGSSSSVPTSGFVRLSVRRGRLKNLPREANRSPKFGLVRSMKMLSTS
jgi:hypothetical protein